jgi:hypothetical protein
MNAMNQMKIFSICENVFDSSAFPQSHSFATVRMQVTALASIAAHRRIAITLDILDIGAASSWNTPIASQIYELKIQAKRNLEAERTNNAAFSLHASDHDNVAITRLDTRTRMKQNIQAAVTSASTLVTDAATFAPEVPAPSADAQLKTALHNSDITITPSRQRGRRRAYKSTATESHAVQSGVHLKRSIFTP